MEILNNLDLRKMSPVQLDKLSQEIRLDKFKLIQGLRSGSEKSIHKYRDVKKYLAKVLTLRSEILKSKKIESSTNDKK